MKKIIGWLILLSVFTIIFIPQFIKFGVLPTLAIMFGTLILVYLIILGVKLTCSE